jgi:hypothetical protein
MLLVCSRGRHELYRAVKSDGHIQIARTIGYAYELRVNRLQDHELF